MSKFSSKKKRANPEVSTASLPDIVFMLLFFFMVATVPREPELQMLLEKPETDTFKRIEDRSKLGFLNMGYRNKSEYGGEPWIQIGAVEPFKFANAERKIKELYPMITKNKKTTGFVLSVKIDSEVPMMYVDELKNILRTKGLEQLEILYSSKPSGD